MGDGAAQDSSGFFTAPEPLTPDAFHALARARGLTPFKARKTAPIAARRLHRETRIETHWNGVETAKTAEAGDWLVTALDENGAALRDNAGQLNQYAVGEISFHDRYRLGAVDGAALSPWGRIFRPSLEVNALFL